MTSVSEKDDVQSAEQLEEREPKTENSDEEEEEEEEEEKGHYNEGHFEALTPFVASTSSANVHQTTSTFDPMVLQLHSNTALLNAYEPVPSAETAKGRRGIKRRKRFTDCIRKRQLREAAAKYAKTHPSVHRQAVRKYAACHPKVHKQAVKKYAECHPEIHREAVMKYADCNPEIHRQAVRKYRKKSLIVEGKREKKKVERLTMQVSSLQKEPFTITPGKGQKLCEIERIQYFLSKKKTDELRNLHKLLYNRPGTVASLKKNVGQFSGYPFEKGSDQYKKKEEMLKKYRNAMLKSICEVLDLERSGVNSELVARILNFLMHPKPSGKPLPKSKKTSSKGGKKERSSSGTARKAKRTKCPEILSDESSSEEDEKKEKDESSEEDKESEEERPKKSTQKEKAKQKTTPKTKKGTKNANVKKADSSTTKKNQNSSKKESESENSSDDEPLIKKLKKKPPTDEELKETVKKLLANANLEEVTMKQICKKVYENYPTYDLTDRKEFIKETVKELIS